MERVIILLLFFSPLSFAGDNTTTIITKGSGSTITSKQVGNGNATNILCGANSNGSFPGTTYVSHTCSNATWSSTITGNSNTTRLYTVWSNNSDNNFTVTVTGGSQDDALYVFQDQIADVARLPIQCKDGYKLKIATRSLKRLLTLSPLLILLI